MIGNSHQYSRTTPDILAVLLYKKKLVNILPYGVATNYSAIMKVQ